MSRCRELQAQLERFKTRIVEIIERDAEQTADNAPSPPRHHDRGRTLRRPDDCHARADHATAIGRILATTTVVTSVATTAAAVSRRRRPRLVDHDGFDDHHHHRNLERPPPRSIRRRPRRRRDLCARRLTPSA